MNPDNQPKKWEIEHLSIKPIDNSYSPKLLFETAEVSMLGYWSDDGRYLVFSTSGDIGYFDFADSTVTYLDYINAEEEFFPSLSPDGKWLTYTSDDHENQDHVYVVPFPGPGRAHRVSVNEGFASVWAPDMKAIYFVGLDNTGPNTSRADIATSPQFSSSPPRFFFTGSIQRFMNLLTLIDINLETPDYLTFILMGAAF